MPTLSVLIPVYNEARNLEAFFKQFYATTCPIQREVIVVDDGSSDGSPQILQKLSQTYGYQLFLNNINQGKGASIRQGIEKAVGDYIVIQDADFEYDPNEISILLDPLLNNRSDVVYGSRFRHNAPQIHRTYHYFANRILTLLSNLFSGIYLTDMETCYKVFRSDLLKCMNLQSNRFGIEVELTAYIAKTTARIMEMPISYYPRTYLQGKKINWRDGVAALKHLIYFNLCVSAEKAFNNLPENYQFLKTR